MLANKVPIRFPLAYRIGVTGARNLEGEAVPALRQAIATVLKSVQQKCVALASQSWAQRAYKLDGRSVHTRLTAVSPLAEGADRLVAEEALSQGYELSVVLPFDQAEYEQDFSNSVDEFRKLLACAGHRVLTLDGDRTAEEWRSYEAVGRLIVRNCDLLIAIWDERKKSQGPRRHGRHYSLATHVGLPVWWIHASGKQPSVLVESSGDLRHPDPIEAQKRLEELLDRQLRPPVPIIALHTASLTRWRQWAKRSEVSGRPKCAHGYDPLHQFLDEIDPPSQSPLERAHAFMRVLSYGVSCTPPQEENSIAELVSDFWSTVYSHPDRLSQAYSARYRSTYVFVILLAAGALICAALSLALEASGEEKWVMPVAILEVLSLTIIFVLVVWNGIGRWHERWIGYRLLAELCRKQRALALLGWSLPFLEVNRAASPGTPRASWIDWYFEAAVRAAPLSTGSLKGHDLEHVRDKIVTTLCSGQTAYHRNRADISDFVSRRLLFSGETCFILTLALVAVKISALSFTGASEGITILGLVATILPALSAALFAIRAYAELEVLADQSERMCELLSAVEKRLGMLDSARPLASQELGVDLFRLATAMLADVAGWAQLFRMKAVEAG